MAIPRGGGKPQIVLAVDRMNFVFEHESGRLAASAARVALIAEIEDARDRTVEWRVYSGAPHGPIGVVRALPIREARVPMSDVCNSQSVDVYRRRWAPRSPTGAPRARSSAAAT